LKTQPLICGDVLHLTFKDNSVKVAVLTFALHDKKKEERGLILKELKRTLCHEGKIIITDFEAPWNIISFLGFGLIIIKELFSGHMKNAISFFNSGGIMQLIELQHAYCILKKRISFPPITINVVSFEPISNM
jgi:ubiquinone/menaquinone biosynthesis C-methylase UbiE